MLPYGTFSDEKAENNPTSETREIKSGFSKSHGFLVSALLVAFTVFAYYRNEFLNIGSYLNEDQTNLKADSDESTITQQPNIVFLLVDDQGYNDIGYNSGDMFLTPTMDALAKDGIVLDRYYSMYVCTPARASLLTGKYAIHTGMHYQVLHESAPWGLPLDHVLVPQLLKTEAGYNNHIVGKWHLGFYHPAFLPTNRGFDSHYGFYAGQEHYWDHNILHTSEPYMDWSENGSPAVDVVGEHSMELMENKVDKIIRQEALDDKPFFLLYSQQAIHYPLESVPIKYLDDDSMDAISEIRDENRKFVGQLTAALDYTVDKLIDVLKETDQYDNTILIVASDNGGCSYHGASNFPLRGSKNHLFDGGLRVPAFIHSPLIPESARGSVFSSLFHVTDWLPTIFGMIGIEKDFGDAIDGIDQWNALLTGKPGDRTEMLHNIEYAYMQHPSQFRAAIQVGDYKLITGETYDQIYDTISPAETDTCSSIFSSSSGHTWVYDITHDESETSDLYHKLSDNEISNLWDKLDDYADTVVDPAFVRDSWDLICYKVWKDHDSWLTPWHLTFDYEAEMENYDKADPHDLVPDKDYDNSDNLIHEGDTF
mmetsp:Transcript_10729/g.13928  ORF Transcript_10729/g.13928 Transcript_10729/m.13928 type:complete len:595 (+) Transcript_10729:77-1861(+)